MGRGKRRGKRSRGARSSSPATRGGKGGRGREGQVDGGDGSSYMAGRCEGSSHGHGNEEHDGGGGFSPPPAGQGGPGDGQSRGRDGGGGDRSSPSSCQSGTPSGQSVKEDSGLANSTPQAAENSRASPSSTTPPCTTTPPSTATAPPILGNPPDDSYAGIMKTSREEIAAHNFYDFLQTYMGSSLGDPIYVAEVKSMRAKKLWRLQIQFQHLRIFERHFAHYVCNNKRQIWGWLLSAVRKFLLAHCVDADGMTSDIINSITNDILLKTELEFIGIPISIESLKIFLKRNSDALSEFMKICFETGKSVLLSSAIGSHTFQACVQHLIKNHIRGHSWNGEFTVADWDVINMAVRWSS